MTIQQTIIVKQLFPLAVLSFSEYTANVSSNIFAEATPELESSTTPLMLTGIAGPDFALTRDFLVMQDDQINVINAYKNQNMEMEDNQSEGVAICNALPSVTEDLNKEKMPDEGIQQITKEVPPPDKKKTVEKKDVRRSKRHITDKKDFCKYYIIRTRVSRKCDTGYLRIGAFCRVRRVRRQLHQRR